jgi:hypothetical protein
MSIVRGVVMMDSVWSLVKMLAGIAFIAGVAYFIARHYGYAIF